MHRGRAIYFEAMLKTSSGVNHGTFLHIAHEEGLIANTSIHAGIRAPVVRKNGDVRNDRRCGFDMVKAREIDRIGVDGVIRRLKDRVAGTKVYISVDIDVLDPAFAPGRHLSILRKGVESKGVVKTPIPEMMWKTDVM